MDTCRTPEGFGPKPSLAIISWNPLIEQGESEKGTCRCSASPATHAVQVSRGSECQIAAEITIRTRVLARLGAVLSHLLMPFVSQLDA
jgi:hypothetical protein